MSARSDAVLAVYEFHGDSAEMARRYDTVLSKVVAVSSGRPMIHLAVPREFGFMVEAGLTPMQAILAGTRDGAELLGLSAEVGTVEKGKVADLVAVAGDPLQDIHLLEHPVLVVHEGKVAFSAP